LLTEAVDDAWQVFTKHLAQLPLDLALNKFLDDSNGVEGAIDINILQGICLKDKRYALLF